LRLQVDLAPAKTQQLTQPHPGRDRQDVERFQPIASGSIKAGPAGGRLSAAVLGRAP